jgi:predicted RNA polymerase sigma factor
MEKWEKILSLYNQLLMIEYSPMAALNRTYALSKVHGKQAAIDEAMKLDLKDQHFYYALLGELFSGLDNKLAVENLEKALGLAKTESDRNTIRKKIERVHV